MRLEWHYGDKVGEHRSMKSAVLIPDCFRTLTSGSWYSSFSLGTRITATIISRLTLSTSSTVLTFVVTACKQYETLYVQSELTVEYKLC